MVRIKTTSNDLLAGLLTAGVGLASVIGALSYNIGTLTRMGPGYFPLILGIVMIVLGPAIMFIEGRETGARPGFDRRVLRPMLLITSAVIVFALTVEPFGLAPAVFLLALLGSMADTEFRWRRSLVLAAGLSLGAVVIFRLALGLYVEVFAWPL